MILNIVIACIVLFVLISLSYVLIKKNKEIYNEINLEKEKMKRFEKDLKKINLKKSSQADLDKFNKIVRDFLKERFNFSDNMTYNQIATSFSKKNMKYAKFFNDLEEFLYSDKKIDSKNMKDLTETFQKMIKKS